MLTLEGITDGPSTSTTLNQGATMNYLQIIESLKKSAIAARLPTMVWGGPGIAKSAAVKQIAAEMSIALIDVRASQTDPVDWRGVPSVSDGMTRWNPPDFLPRSGRGILFLDELSAAPPAVQVALYQLLLDRRCGDYIMPDGWFVIGAGNRQEDRAVANRMSTALANRLVHLNMDVDVDLWLDWFWQNPLSEIQQAETVGFFIGFRRELLHSFDPTSRDLAYPTPRSWEMVAKLQATGLSPELESPLISGAVGTGASAEYLAFCRIYRSLPSLDSILLDPQQAKIPEEPSAKAAVVAGLAKKASPSNIGAILTYCARISREFEFMAVHLSRRFCPDVDHTRDMTKWQAANSKFLMAS